MARYCLVCGRRLIKSIGPIGPTCLKKQSQTTKNNLKIDYMKKHDLFIDEGDLNEQGEAQEASSSIASKKDVQNCKSKTASTKRGSEVRKTTGDSSAS